MSFKAENLTVEFVTGDSVMTALGGVDVTIERGEFVALLGPSGCGKSTLLMCMGGLTEPTSGQVRFDGDPVEEPDPHRAAFVFQDYSLLPWKSALENVAFGQRLAGVPKAQRERRASELLEEMGLQNAAEKRPDQLSGGMQQRVALARALAMSPSVLLMDEPFGALDELTRRALGANVSQVLTEEAQTVVLVTHSIEEAVFWADRVLVMCASPGRIVQEVRIDVPRPRTEAFFTDPEFTEYRTELFKLISYVTPKLSDQLK